MWNAETGDWDIETNWNPTGVPAESDTITINSGTATINSNKIINGGSLTVSDAGTLTTSMTMNIHAATVNTDGTGGSLVTLKNGGTINVGTIVVGHAGSGTAMFEMTGGKLNATGFTLGTWHSDGKPIATISGGVLDITSLTSGDRGFTLNIIGNGSTWAVDRMTLKGSLQTKSTNLQFTAGEFGVTNGAANTAFSTINVSGNVQLLTSTLREQTVPLVIGVDMSNYFYDGAAYVTGDLTQTLVSAGGELTITDTTFSNVENKITDGWKLEKSENEKQLVLTFDESQFAFADVSSGSGFALGNLGTEGWVTLTGDASETVDLSMAYSGVENVEDFVTWLQESMGDDVTVRGSEDVITFENLVLDEYGKGYLNFGLSAYTGGNVAFVDGSNHVPEPATWAMLVIGVGALGLGRLKR
ncbi:MAG: PEP-CTERM sorting domain-containing protein [Planctomycetia bacterium]|nr:PEP-CTERM sorting domain-containing protein [Planctomycetia bacterium]